MKILMERRRHGVLHGRFYRVSGKTTSHPLAKPRCAAAELAGVMGDLAHTGACSNARDGWFAVSGLFPMLAVRVFLPRSCGRRSGYRQQYSQDGSDDPHRRSQCTPTAELPMLFGNWSAFICGMTANLEREAKLIATHLLKEAGESAYEGSNMFADLVEMAKMAIQERNAAQRDALAQSRLAALSLNN